MSDNTTDTQNTDTAETTYTPEQVVAMQAEIEKLRKHSETLLAEKKAEQEKRRAEQAEKDKQAQEIARKKGDFETLEKQYQDKIAQLEQQIIERDKQRDSDMIKLEAQKMASSLSDNPNNQAILQMLIEKRLVVDNGQIKVADESGALTISTIDDLKKEIETGGKYDSLIIGTRASGAGSAGVQASKQAADYTEAERLHIANTNPQLFKQLFME